MHISRKDKFGGAYFSVIKTCKEVIFKIHCWRHTEGIGFGQVKIMVFLWDLKLSNVIIIFI